MSVAADKLKEQALRLGATVIIDGKTFNAEKLKLAPKRPAIKQVVIVTPPKAVEPPQPKQDTVAIVSAMLAESMANIAKQVSADRATMMKAIASFGEPRKRMVVDRIIPKRSGDGVALDYQVTWKEV